MTYEELIAAYLDGNTTLDETIRIVRAMERDKNLSELILNCFMLDGRKAQPKNDSKGRVVDMRPRSEAAVLVAAKNEAKNCEIQCELYIMRNRGQETDDLRLTAVAKEKGWLGVSGTKLDDFGRLLEYEGWKVERRRQSAFDDLKEAIDHEKYVLVAVDGGELIGDRPFERFEDQCIGKIPDHAVVVTAYDDILQAVSIYDPTMGDTISSYTFDIFLDAWDDSNNYMVIVE